MKILLPQDVRAIDILSCTATIFLAIDLFVFNKHADVNSILVFRNTYFWSVVLLSIGLCHLLTLLLYPIAEILRSLACFLSGIFWTYLGLSYIGEGILPTTLTYLFGLSCLYSSMLTLLLEAKLNARIH